VAELVGLEQVLQLMGVARIEAGHSILEDRRVFPAKALPEELRDLLDIEIIDPGQKSEGEDVLTLVTTGAADGLHGLARDGDTHVAIALQPLGLRRHMIGIIQDDPTELHRVDVPLIAVLIERQKHVGLVTGRQHVA